MFLLHVQQPSPEFSLYLFRRNIPQRSQKITLPRDIHIFLMRISISYFKYVDFRLFLLLTNINKIKILCFPMNLKRQMQIQFIQTLTTLSLGLRKLLWSFSVSGRYHERFSFIFKQLSWCFLPSFHKDMVGIFLVIGRSYRNFFSPVLQRYRDHYSLALLFSFSRFEFVILILIITSSF